MNIDDVDKYQMDEQLAYILGMCYPLYKTLEYKGKKYLLGACNHNKISGEDLISHIHAVNEFLKCSKIIQGIEMYDNSVIKGIKKGFSILIEINKPFEKIFTNRVQEIINSSDNIKKKFICGCFDGRASWDTSRHYISLDVDRDNFKQDLINKISLSVGIELNINNRGDGANKNDQIRVMKKCVNKFLDEIGLFSECRKNIIKNNIKLKDS